MAGDLNGLGESCPRGPTLTQLTATVQSRKNCESLAIFVDIAPAVGPPCAAVLPLSTDIFLFALEPFHHDQQHHERSLRHYGVAEVGRHMRKSFRFHCLGIRPESKIGFTFEEIERCRAGQNEFD